MSAKDPPIARYPTGFADTAGPDDPRYRFPAQTKPLTFEQMKAFADKLHGNGFGCAPVPGVQVIEPIEWTPELEEAWGRGGKLVDLPDAWSCRKTYIDTHADCVRNFDRWRQLKAAAEMWETLNGGPLVTKNGQVNTR